jgi:AmiR/NasT family two-component response regulator
MTGALDSRVGAEMTDNANSNPLWPDDLIEQATGIIMNRFNLDSAHALEVLRRMSQNTRTQMCVVAEQVINHNVPLEAVRGLEERARS